MASTSKQGLRRLWFQIHKWIGILLAILIIPLSLSGSALVWHDWLEEQLYPQRFAVSGAPVLAPSAYGAAALGAAGPGHRLSGLRYPEAGAGGAVVAALVRPPASGERGLPARVSVWLDPADARVIDQAGSNAGVIRFLHGLHGSFLIPGWGRQLVGWLGVAMLLSCLTGLWLWWPTVGKWTRGLRWRRARELDTNLHHMTGFWVAIPLAMLSFTGIWISFPQVFAPLTGAPAPNPGDRMARMRSLPLAELRLTPEAAVAAALGARDGTPAAITWPTDRSPRWSVSIATGKGRPASIEVEDSTGAAAPGRPPPQRDPTARLMRQLHDGNGMGIAWQILIFVGGIIPALLGVTGILMWLRTRRWRRATDERISARRDAALAEG